ncbi:MAG: zinc-binding dehydrogenase [Chloroflexi bacterium]|nr:zinc-binding dehydrogenase [Chloroflexota bacterium]MDA1145812.1 zinc-binding dehydrogenase [Chloroflexota bacterium]
MRAAVYQGAQRFEVTELPTPEPGPGQILVQVRRSAICGTDVHAFMYDIAPPGSVIGHEIAGVVAAVGSDVTRWSVGDRVVAGGGEHPDGQQSPMRTHPRYNYRTMGFPGGATGGYAEYQLLPEWRPTRIPDNVSDDAAALTEPCSVAVHAARRSAIKLGDTVAVLGAGPIGMLVMQAARAAGATRVLVSEPAPARAEAARALGADAVIDPRSEDVVERIVALTGGVGADVIFDCAGIKDTLNNAFDATKRDGQVVLVAVPWEPLPVDPVDWMGREIDFRVSFASLPEDWRIALDLLSTGRISAQALMSEASFIALDDIQEAFEGLMKPSSQLQVVINL